MTTANTSLLFIYNADSGLFNLLSDVAKKSFTGSGTCSLCDLTHDPLSMKNEWKEFIEQLPMKTEFDYKDTFLKKHPEMNDLSFPVLFLKEKDGSLRELLSAERINATKDLAELKRIIETSVDKENN